MTRHSQEQRNQLLLIFWSLLFVKCFTLEYLVLKYEAPINTSLYVWSLSIFMATVATLVKFRIERSPISTERTVAIHQVLWALALTGIGGLGIANAFGKILETVPTLTVIAVLIGTGYTAQGILLKQARAAIIGFIWWLSAALLSRSSSPNSFLLFSICLLTLISLPTIVLYFRKPSEPKQGENPKVLSHF